jgi:uncharacterized RmlC-like cupin family protein
MNSSPAIRIIHPDEFDVGTAQTPGSERRAAVSPQLGVATALWGGLFEVEPGARTGIHHHGEQQTVAYVLSGSCEVRWGAKGEHRDPDRGQSAGRHLVLGADGLGRGEATPGIRRRNSNQLEPS